MTSSIKEFFSPEICSLKICGVTLRDDALRLVELKISALGVNFWPQSKRYISPEDANDWLLEVREKIIRVGVFVNASTKKISAIYEQGLIDIVQLHGDENLDFVKYFIENQIPCIKAVGVKNSSDLKLINEFQKANGILLDTAAPGIYGGTGHTFDWTIANQYKLQFSQIPLILAGGITLTNIQEAKNAVSPAVIDIASGAEISPGIKNFETIAAILAKLNQ
jgi:phosphoribosylanthranilate isomerase